MLAPDPAGYSYSAETWTRHAKEAQLADEVMAALKARGGGTFVHLSGTGCVGTAHGADGAAPGEFTDWADLEGGESSFEAFLVLAVVGCIWVECL